MQQGGTGNGNRSNNNSDLVNLRGYIMIYTTHYYINGQKWSGERINAICWADAECQASIKGLEVTGQLIKEIPCDNNGDNIQWSEAIDYNTN